MSLINEALKKAQRSRTVGADGSPSPVPSGGFVAKRGPAQSANTMLLIGSGAVVLVVVSVVATVFLLNRSETKPAAQAAQGKPAPVAAADTTAPVVKPSPPSAPAPSSVHVTLPPSPTPAGAPATETAAPAAATPPPASVAVQPSVAPATSPSLPQAVAAAAPITPAPRPPAAKSTPAPAAPLVALPAVAPSRPTPEPVAKPDERIAAFIEAMRITGVRSSGDDARVLIGGRLFKVNDIIDRPLGVRLVKVAPGVLTFADANGVTYAKNH